MPQPTAPPEIVALAEERATARQRRDWGLADELRARIETTGWQVVDSGLTFDLLRARPADIVEADETIYGSVASVPSRLDEPAAAAVSIVVLPGPTATEPGAALSALATHPPSDGQILTVVDRDTSVDGPADEVIRSVEPFSPGDALQAAVQRATGELIVVLDADRQVGGDIVGPLRDALHDARVAAAGIEGIRSSDLRRYQPAGPGDCTALRSGCYAFRREDARRRGPIDGRLRLPGSVATWWTLTLRDEGPDVQPRRVIAVDLPIEAMPDVSGHDLPADHARLARRDAYRIADLMGQRSWLAAQEPPGRRSVGDGPRDHEGRDDRDQADHTSHA